MHDSFKNFVYLVRSGSLCKIGSSINIKQRIRQLQSEVPDKIELIAQAETYGIWNHLDLERKIQRHFAHKKHHGEWFNLDDEDIEEAKELMKQEVVENRYDPNILVPVRDFQRNMYNHLKKIDTSLVVTKQGKPWVHVHKVGDQQIEAQLYSGNAHMFEAQSMSVFNSSGFSDEDAQKLAKQMRTLFENNTQIPQNTSQGEEVQDEEKHNHSR